MKTIRNLRGLFVLGLILSIIPTFAGGVILALGWSRPSFTQPMWQFGQYVLLLGLTNLLVYTWLYLQVRKLIAQYMPGEAS